MAIHKSTGNGFRYATFIGMDVAQFLRNESYRLDEWIVRMKKYWKIDVVILCVILVIGIFVWPGARQVNRDLPFNLKGYGGKLTSDRKAVLSQLNADLYEMVCCIQANSDEIVLMDPDKEIKCYRFAYETLWCDEKPILTGVRSFFFEYRNAWGYLLPRAGRNLQSIESVGYTARICSNGKEVVTTSRVEIPYSVPFSEDQSDKLMAVNSSF